MVRVRTAIASMTIVLAAILAGCIGGPDPGPGPGAYRMEFEGGTGFREIFSYVNTTGPFPLRAVIDVEWHVVFAIFSDGVIHWWNFSNERSITHGTWPPAAGGCPKGGLELLANHSLLRRCGSSVEALAPDGTIQASIPFSGNLTSFAVAEGARLLVGATEAPPALELRELDSGALRSRIALTRSASQVSVDSAGRLIGIVTGGEVTFLDQSAQTNRSLGSGTVRVPEGGNYSWAALFVFSGPYDALLAFDEPSDGSPRFTTPLEHGPTHALAVSEEHLYTSPDGTEAGFYAAVGAYEYSRGAFRPLTDVRNLVYVYGLNGSLARGASLPGPDVHIKMLPDGSFFAVSGLRAVLGGSQLWLTHAAANSTLPVLVRHNLTA